MAELATIARPYAEAIFDLAKERNHFDDWSVVLNFLRMIVEDPLMVSVIANPQVDKNTLTQIWLAICEGELSETGNNLVKILVENHRLLAIPQIAIQYETLKAQYQGYLEVEIMTPYPVTMPQQQAIETVLQQRLGKTAHIHITTDESLLGGWLVRAGDQIMDVSIKGRLQKLAAELRH
ncbi:MAG: F0F1 ATP synthase subunit delta [Thioploca sp.]|nr:F0F1 ATP synthase subunit delta [Thioploca sp.]